MAVLLYFKGKGSMVEYGVQRERMRNFYRKCSLKEGSQFQEKNATGKASLLFGSLDTAVNLKKVLQFGKTINHSRCRRTLLGAPFKRVLLKAQLYDRPSVVRPLQPYSSVPQRLPLNPAYFQATTEHKRGSRGRPVSHPKMCDCSNREPLLNASPTAWARLPKSYTAAQVSSAQFSPHLLFFLKCLCHQPEALAAHSCSSPLPCTDTSQDKTFQYLLLKIPKLTQWFKHAY